MHADLQEFDEVDCYGNRYSLMLVDDYTGGKWVYPLSRLASPPLKMLKWDPKSLGPEYQLKRWVYLSFSLILPLWRKFSQKVSLSS